MILQYGNIYHILSIIIPFIILFLLYFILRNRETRTKKIVVFILMLINLIQHIFKPFVWYPIYHGNINVTIITAYNLCACLIILSPIVFLINNRFFKESMFYFGFFAGFVAIVVPYWFIGHDIKTWEYLRFYVCHSLLIITSLLPHMIHLFDIKFSHFPLYALFFLTCELIVICNNLCVNFFKNGYDLKLAYETLYKSNPIWVMHPNENFEAYNDILRTINIKPLYDSGLPFLWNIIPLYLGITVIGFFLNLANAYDADC